MAGSVRGPLGMAAATLAMLMAGAALTALVAHSQYNSSGVRTELASMNRRQRFTMLDHLDAGESADGEYEDQTGDGYECCWHAPNPKLASTTVASKVGPNGWGSKADADGSVDHYTNALGDVPEWVFKGTADHQWKDYDSVYGQQWYENTYPSGESGI
ncbi:hypothetical protein GUITHDRAFT_166563 [Guillardia theta CCMP2712]|uniref:Uncharacterized protein n=2 Tax=Guillardia theta TaxID=55529 RepID=L1I9X7_GUITC|nr:hypothetical protein GUITHDRAFT_166563 [Guillardia theta CCMP2712]EKX33033.1 hypothetical protein GUITHDRAFT_166563 [Guillardia theta CCMP2712]|eukprot:XP_005820013.1 hypothetical protein GUITHDRAFT_166563 [Guillardia theta CCMP2712]